ncbi:HD-GYP domain-containing protein [Marinospirillum alkaliphilum]|uniref:HD domain-containing protein n=1 Tax=Marinospirillum alkaliphilum DSM 21637 TaxID=1122209 RepID=A0A1K1UFM5_9GAMM|nr:HD domain-containing phosphohydrolase [Marinospirillum alkaliphilum]SFX11632.1 HD domain-containing protein [Marinospirillum alkaliphilum DSM 21637]
MLEKLRPSELAVGRKTTLDIYTRGGRLLLSKGAVIGNQEQIELLLARGLVKRDPSDRVDYSSEFKPFRYSANVNPFLEVLELEDQLSRTFRHLKSGAPGAPEAFQRDIRMICSQIIGLAERAPEALLGTVHWPRAEEGSYSIYHPIQCAILIAVVAQKLKMHGEQLFCTLAAALTANIGMLTVQDKLNRQKSPLTDEQREQIRNHPERSVELLEAIGVKDPMWIRAVLHHHERLDGSGYPKGLKGDEIANEARLLALADIYIALIGKREYRQALPVKVALRQIFSERGTLVGPALTKLFLNQIGVYPPGTAVKLKNGDTAVVTERSESIHHPICAGIRAISGQVYMHPPPRDTKLEEFNIVEVLSSDLLKPLQPFLFWGVHVRKAVEL